MSRETGSEAVRCQAEDKTQDGRLGRPVRDRWKKEKRFLAIPSG